MKIDTHILKQNSDTHFVLKASESQKYIIILHNYSGTLEVDIQTEGAEVYILGLYIGKKKDVFNVKTIQRHSQGNSISDLLIKGVFYDSSKFTYEGLINIKKGAHGSNAYQKNQNLMMSKNVFVDSRPFLEIEANDVRCTHGSTTGKLNKEELNYLYNRGLNKKASEKLLINGFIEDVKNRMRDVGVEEQMIKNLI